MRLITTLQDERQAIHLSKYLKSQNIENELDLIINQDWGDSNYGATICQVWIIHEEDLEKAKAITQDFISNSQEPRFQVKEEPSRYIVEEESCEAAAPPRPWNREPMGLATLYLLITCCLLYFFTESTSPASPPPPSLVTENGLPYIPLYYSPLKKNLLFDYPHAFEIIDEMMTHVDVDQLQNGMPLPNDLNAFIKQYKATPYWHGAYEKMIHYFSSPSTPWDLHAPMFEKIQVGEWWRLISPAFLHADIFHLLFNMIFLVVLGKQLEQRLGWARYLIFIVLAGVATNLAQYLMSGVNFLGFSGIICAMITFIWIRQRKTPWEGYLLQPLTFNFTFFFLFLVLIIQLISFSTEIIYHQSITPLIANTAHMTGLLLGLIFGNTHFFAWNNR